ncbi:MAG: 2-phospho-L-lactate guanylyltransferase [Chloroflexota bacterium]
MSQPDRSKQPDRFRRVVALVPVRSLETAKSRLGGRLDAEERQALVRDLLERTVATALATAGLGATIVVSADEALLELARSLGAEALRESGSGLNAALDEARRAAISAGATAVLALPADLPRVSPAAIEAVLEAGRSATRQAPERPVVVLVPDRHGEGTNALLVAPPDAIPFAFGPGSRRRHADLAAGLGATYRELEGGALSLDLDTPEDLLLAGGPVP